MEMTKTRKQGNATVITLASNLHVPVNKEFYICKFKDGAISLIPKLNDMFANVKPNQYKDADTDNLAKSYTPK